MCAIPFILPYHQRPLTSFQPEWLAIAIGVAASVTALINATIKGSLNGATPTVAWLLAFVILIAAQSMVKVTPYLSVPALAIAYVTFAALLTWLGAQLAFSCGVRRTATVLAGFILAGALANAAAAIIQFYGRPTWLEDLVAGSPGNIAYGNIAQPNLFANYMALGQAALMYLWVRGYLRISLAACLAVFLAYGDALSGSRSALMFSMWLIALAILAARTVVVTHQRRRLTIASIGMTGVIVAAAIAVPWVNNALSLDSVDMIQRVATTTEDSRWQQWGLGLRLFIDSPVLGNGFGSFPGAAFEKGLTPAMINIDIVEPVWTSPHNILITLLAETGAAGAALVFAALGVWWWSLVRKYFAGPQLELWWVASTVGIAMLHSLVEFPLWSAHFLGVTALVVGVGSTVISSRRPPMAFITSACVAVACAMLTIGLAISLRDYIRFESSYVTGTKLTLSSELDSKRDAQIMRNLTNGLLAQPAERQIFIGLPLRQDEVPMALPMSARVMRYWPSHTVVVRRAIYLAYAGYGGEAKDLLIKAVQSFPLRCKAGIALLEKAATQNPEAISPLVAVARLDQPVCR